MAISSHQRSMIDMAGRRVGRLTVIRQVATERPGAHWLCRCDCGTQKVISGGNLRRGDTVSCGCKRRENNRNHPRAHGLVHTSEYTTWMSMKARCSRPSVACYPNYGGRGIRVCERWESSFLAFYEDMGRKPSPQHSIDRIDNDGDYEPGNCRWATPAEQACNRRPASNSRFVTAFGQTKTVSEWSRLTGISNSTLDGRLNRGWRPGRSLTKGMKLPLVFTIASRVTDEN